MPVSARRASAARRSKALLAHKHLAGGDRIAHEEFTHEQSFTLEMWTRYLITQTNVIAATDAGTEDIAAVAGWIRESLRPLFTRESETFPFACAIDVFRRSG